MSRFDDVQVEWRINAIERDLHQKADKHEIHSISGDVDSLQRILREACADIVWLRNELAAAQSEIAILKDSHESK